MNKKTEAELKVPGVTHVGGDLALRGYKHPLPESLTHVGGYLDLWGYKHPLPKSLVSVGGYLYLEGYKYPLPAGLIAKERGMIEKIIIEALGQTMNHEGETLLLVGDMPVDCLVLFVSKDEWAKIKDTVQLKG